MDSNHTRSFSLRNREIERWEAMRSKRLCELGIPINLLGKDIVIYIFEPGIGDFFNILESVDTTIQSAHFDGADITLVLPPTPKISVDGSISSVKRNLWSEKGSWLAIIEQHYVERNNRMLKSVIQEFGSLILDGFDRNTASADEWKKDMGNRLMLMEELEEWEEQGIDYERLEEIKNSEGSWFIEAISSYSEDKIKSDIGEFPVHVCFS